MSVVAGIVMLALTACGSDANSPSAGGGPSTEPPLSATEQACVRNDWQRVLLKVGGLDRKVLWKAPSGAWPAGVILVLHGGGGKADDFCAGGALVQPQIAFTELAVRNGFAVFLLDATDNLVTDAQARPCGRRFDFAVGNRTNIDLPYIEQVMTMLVPSRRPSGSSPRLFVTGLSTGGYMTIRAASHFDGLVTAFAPVSAGDPYGTDPICDPSLSPRDSAVGILVDRETRLEITDDNACLSASYPRESVWESQNPAVKPAFKQFLHQKDGVVDFSCAQKANITLTAAGYPDLGAFVIDSLDQKNVFYHLCLNAYNEPLVDFFKSF